MAAVNETVMGTATISGLLRRGHLLAVISASLAVAHTRGDYNRP